MKSTRQNAFSVNEVKLPKWARTEHDFIRIQREILESDYAHKQLKHWFDLVFGAAQGDYNQLNIFFSYAYEV